MNHDDPSDPITPPSTPCFSNPSPDPYAVPSIQLPKESPLITGMTAALLDNIKDFHMPVAAYPSNSWIIADDHDIPSLAQKTNTQAVPSSPSTSQESTSQGSDNEASTSQGSTSQGSTSQGSTSETSTSQGSDNEASTSETSTSQGSTSQGSDNEASTSQESTSQGSDKEASISNASEMPSDRSTGSGSEEAAEFSWSDVEHSDMGASDSEKEDNFVLPPREWEGIPGAIIVLFFAFMFAQSIGIWTGRITF